MPEFRINSSVEKPIYHFSSYCWLSSRNSCPVSSQHDQKDFQIYKANNAHKHPIMDINLTMHIVIPGIVKQLVSIQINTLLIWFLSDQQLQYKTYYNFSEERKGKEKENQPTNQTPSIHIFTFRKGLFTSFSPPMLFVSTLTHSSPISYHLPAKQIYDARKSSASAPAKNAGLKRWWSRLTIFPESPQTNTKIKQMNKSFSWCELLVVLYSSLLQTHHS